MVGAQARREQARYATGRGLSQRRACALLKVSRSMLGYAHRMPVKNAPVVEAMKTLSGKYPRFGSRRIRVLLERQGIVLGKDRCAALWAKAGLSVPKKRPRRRIAQSRPRPHAPHAMNAVWSYDFVYDACANGQQLKCLTVVDEFTRECLAIDVAGSIRSKRLIEVLSRLISLRGAPRYLRSDKGPNSRAAHFSNGRSMRRSRPPSSIPASPGRTERTNPSTANSVTSVRPWSGSATAPRPASSLKTGGGTTTKYGRIRACSTRPRRLSAGPSKIIQQLGYDF